MNRTESAIVVAVHPSSPMQASWDRGVAFVDAVLEGRLAPTLPPHVATDEEVMADLFHGQG